MVELQEQLQQEQVCVQQWRRKCEEISKEVEKWKSQCVSLEIDVSKLNEQCSDLRGKLTKVETTLELECYRAEAKIHQQWEAREERLVQQLNELQ